MVKSDTMMYTMMLERLVSNQYWSKNTVYRDDIFKRLNQFFDCESDSLARFFFVSRNELNCFSCYVCDFIHQQLLIIDGFPHHLQLLLLVCIIYTVSPEAYVTVAPSTLNYAGHKRFQYADEDISFKLVSRLVQQCPTKVPVICKTFSINCHLLLLFHYFILFYYYVFFF